MPVGEVNSTSSAIQTAAKSSAASALESDFNTFITLLTAQVENQDPLEPLDSTQFVEQLATFSALEQQVESNSHLQAITDLLRNSSGSSAAALIGTAVASPEISAAGPFPDIAIATESPVSSGTLIVRNSDGTEIFRAASADGRFSWNGTTTGGAGVPLDDYRFEVQTDEGTVRASAVGTVERLITSAAGEELDLGGGVFVSRYTPL